MYWRLFAGKSFRTGYPFIDGGSDSDAKVTSGMFPSHLGFRMLLLIRCLKLQALSRCHLQGVFPFGMDVVSPIQGPSFVPKNTYSKALSLRWSSLSQFAGTIIVFLGCGEDVSVFLIKFLLG